MILQPKRNFLKASDVQEGDEITFLNEGEWVENRKFTNSDGTAKQQCIFQVDYQGETKDLAINSTSRNTLILHFGKETKDWVNKKAKIQLVKQNVAGSLKDVLYLDPIITVNKT